MEQPDYNPSLKKKNIQPKIILYKISKNKPLRCVSRRKGKKKVDELFLK